jgi:hypothetical protein
MKLKALIAALSGGALGFGHHVLMSNINPG